MSFFPGVYEFVSSDNIEEFLKASDVGWMTRKVAVFLKPNLTFIDGKDGTFTLKVESTMRNTEFKFTPGVESEELLLDGRKSQSTVTFDGNKHIHVQKVEGNVNIKMVREFIGNDLNISLTCKNATAHQVYKKVGK